MLLGSHFLFGGRPSGKTRTIVGLEEFFYVVLGIEDFTVDTVIWYVTFIAVILSGTSAHSESGGELCISDEAFAVEQRMIILPQIPAFGHYVSAFFILLYPPFLYEIIMEDVHI